MHQPGSIWNPQLFYCAHQNFRLVFCPLLPYSGAHDAGANIAYPEVSGARRGAAKDLVVLVAYFGPKKSRNLFDFVSSPILQMEEMVWVRIPSRHLDCSCS